jgi:hypothetical protein
MRMPAVLLALFVALSASARTQAGLSRPAVVRLQSLARKSAYIFSGQVKSVSVIPARQAGSVPVIQITFQITTGFRGVHAGEELVIREWAGLWQSGQSYRSGERVALFLYPPSKLGLTSVVGGAGGRFKVDGGGRIVIDPTRLPGVLEPSPGRPHEPILLNPSDFGHAVSANLE